MANNVANLQVQIGADIGDFQNNMQTVTSTLQGLGTLEVGKILTNSISKPIADIATTTLKAAGDFEQGMADIKAVSGATGTEMDNLTELALEMGAETKYSAKEAASGIEELVKAGVGLEDIANGGLKGALNLATAGNLELADAAEIASTALNAFKADGLNVEKAGNLLAGAANASATSVGELKYGLSPVSAVASAVGLSFDDTVTTLATFAQNGLKGSDAGTSLKTMLMNLQPSTKAQVEVFKKLNLVTEDGKSKFFDASGSIKSMADIAGTLQNSMKGMTDAQRLSTMQTIFGSDAIRAGNILFKEGATGIKKMKSAMGNVTAEQVAAEKMNTFKGSVEEMKGTIETAMIKIGTGLLPVLQGLANFVTVLVNGFMGLNPTLQGVIGVVLGLVAAIGPVLMIIGGVQLALPVLGAAFAALTSPVGLIVASIVGLIAIFTVLWNTNETFRNAIIGIWEAIKVAAITIFGYMQKFWNTWGGTITGIFQNTFEILKIAFSAIFSVISSIVMTVFNSIKQFWQTWGGLITALFQTTFGFWATIFKTAFEQIKLIISTVINLISGIIKLFLSILKGDWEGAFKALESIVKTIFGFISGTIQNTVNSIAGVIGVFANGIVNIWNGLWNGVKTTVLSIFNSVYSKISSFINDAIDLFNYARNYNF